METSTVPSKLVCPKPSVPSTEAISSLQEDIGFNLGAII